MKKTISLILCIAMIFSTISWCLPAFAIDLDFDVETYEDYAPTQQEAEETTATASVLGTTEVTVQPGLNILTGTTADYKFTQEHLATTGENGIVSYQGSKNIKLLKSNVGYGVCLFPSVVGNAVSAADGGYKLDFETDADRPFVLSFDIKNRGTVVFYEGFGTKRDAFLEVSSTSTNYRSKEEVITYADMATKFGVPIVSVGVKAGTNADLYIRNLSLVPYYKVTVKDCFGDVMFTEYVDPSETRYDLSEDVLAYITDEFDGFVIEGTETVVTGVDLANKDVTLCLKVKDGVEMSKATSDASDASLWNAVVAYGFEAAIDPATFDADAVAAGLGAVYVELFETNDGLLAYFSSEDVKPGEKASLNFYFSELEIAGTAKTVVFPQTNVVFETGVAEEYQYDNFFVLGDNDGAYAYPSVIGADFAKTVIKEISTEHYAKVEEVYTPETPQKVEVGAYANLEDGATYYFSAQVSADTEDFVDLTLNINTDSVLTLSDSTVWTKASNGDHIKVIEDVAEDWRRISVEFTVDKTSGTADYFGIYSTPGDETVYFSVDNFALYKKMEGSFEAGEYASLIEGKSAPEDFGFYAFEDTNYTMPEMVYEVSDERITINGWEDQNGNVYEVGETYEITESLVLTPHIEYQEGIESVVVRFTGDVKSVPAEITGLLTGDTLDLSDYYGGMQPLNINMRFNGWEPVQRDAGPVEEFTITAEDIVDGVVELRAYVNYDINFAVPQNQTGDWKFNLGTVTYDGKHLVATYDPINTHHDIRLANTSFNIPMAVVKGVDFYIHETLQLDGVDTPFTGAGYWYFGSLGEGANANKKIDAVNKGKVDGYVHLAGETYTHKLWSGAFGAIHADIKDGHYSYKIRYIRMVPADKFPEDELEVFGINAPAVGMPAGSEYTTSSEKAVVTDVRWTPALKDGRFEDNKVYELEIDVMPADKTGVMFDESITTKLFGEEVSKRVNTATGVMTLKKEFTTPTGNYVDFELGLEGETSIMIDGKTRKYTPVFSAEIPDKTLTWEVSDESVATISEDGVLTILKDGDITITATSDYKTDVSAQIDVEINYYAVAITISGPETIDKAGRTTEYTANVVSQSTIGENTVTWSIDNTSIARIDAVTGKLVPFTNGTVTITATSNYDNKTTDTFEVTLTNQGELGTIVYNSGVQGDDVVEGLPSEPQRGIGNVTLSDAVPTREGYIFTGWATSDESVEAVKNIVLSASETVDVYAIWKKAFLAFEFNGTNEGFSTGAAKTTAYDTYVEIVADPNSNGDVTFSKTYNFNPKIASELEIRMSSNSGASSVGIYYDPDGKGIVYGSIVHSFSAQSEKMESLDKWVVINVDLLSIGTLKDANTIGQVRLDPFNGPEYTARIDYIRLFETQRTITFDANTSDEVTNMPETQIVTMGKKLEVKTVPVREGYTFLGWSKVANPAAGDAVKTSYLITDDTVFYAIWAKSTEGTRGSAELDVTSSEALLIETKANSSVKVTYTDEAGEPVVLNLTANANGYVVVDLREDGEVTDVKVSGTRIYEVLETTYSVATYKAEEVDDEEEVQDPSASTPNAGGNYTGGTVSTITKPGAIIPDGEELEIGGGAEERGSILEDMASTEEILINFDKEHHADLFPESSVRWYENKGMSNSVIKFTNLGVLDGGKNIPTLFTPDMEFNTQGHRYVVVKGRIRGGNGMLKLSFRDASSPYSVVNSMSRRLGEDWTMAVYDMSTLDGWRGIIQAMSFAADKTVGATIEFDWILFTDELPEGIDAIPGTVEIFPTVNESAPSFTDVTKEDWFNEDVTTAYRLGFVEGVTKDSYNPYGQVTIAELVTLAVRLNYIYSGKELPEVAEGAEWYSNYVEAAQNAGIITATQFADYNAPALRKQVAQVMQKTLPLDYMQNINMFTNIPDGDKKDPSYSAILKMYNVGIMIGSDAENNFYANTSITRAEIAAVINRMANPDTRKRVVTPAERESKRKFYYAEDIVKKCVLSGAKTSKLALEGEFAVGESRSDDPIVSLSSFLCPLDGKNVYSIMVAFRVPEGAKIDGQLFFTTAKGSWAQERRLLPKHVETLKDGTIVYEYDALANEQFADTITGLRFDPVSEENVKFEIQYIAIG